MPNDLVVLQGGFGTMSFNAVADPLGALQTLVPGATAALSATTAVANGTVSLTLRDKARMQGYEGEACGECGNYTLVRNGTCMKCNTCGGTSGCS